MSGSVSLQGNVEFRGNRRRWEWAFYTAAAGHFVVYVVKSAIAGQFELILGNVLASALIVAIGRAARDVDRALSLSFDQEGLTIARLLTQKVPWNAVQWYSCKFDRGVSSTLSIGIVRPALYGRDYMTIEGPWPFTKSGIRIRWDGVEGNEDEVEAAFRRFAPHVPKV